MKKLFFLLISGLLSACGGKNADQEGGSGAPGAYAKISSAEVKHLMDEGGGYILLDVRTGKEYNAGHIEGAMLIPDYEIKDRASREIPDKGSRIIVYCRSGMRSAGTARALVKLGYTRVFDLGGIMHWPYETVRGTK